jgi:hypothetical protein
MSAPALFEDDRADGNALLVELQKLAPQAAQLASA